MLGICARNQIKQNEFYSHPHLRIKPPGHHLAEHQINPFPAKDSLRNQAFSAAAK